MKLKILVLNEAPTDKYLEQYNAGSFPGHHLYGIVELRRDHDMEVVIPKQVKYKWLNRIGEFFDIGLLDQQIRGLFTMRKCDIVYAPYAAANTKFLVLMKMLGLMRTPIVALVHFALFGRPSKNKWKRALVKHLIMQYDTLLFLSHKMKQDMIDAYGFDDEYAEKHFHISSWGPDMDFFKKFYTGNEPEKKHFAISSGTTYRDFNSLVSAFHKINFPLKLYCTPQTEPTVPIPPNVEVFSGKYPFEQICKDYNDSRLILIPLAPNPEGTMGFTSLMDAMAMHKPVIMTRNDKVDVDFEGEDIGAIVEELDVDGWANAINGMLEDYPRLKEMGENCARIGQTELNISVFASKLAEVFHFTYENSPKRMPRKFVQLFL